MRNKALSNVVATLVLILVGILSVGVVSVAFANITKKIQMSPEKNCFEFNIKKPLKIGGVCYNPGSREIELNIKRGFDDIVIESIEIVSDNGIWNCGGSCGNCIIPEIGQTGNYYIFSENNPGSIEIRAGGCVVETRKIPLCNEP